MEVHDSSAPELRAALASLQARVQEQEALISKQSALLDTLIVEQKLKTAPGTRPREGLAAATARAVVAPSGIRSSAVHSTSGSIFHRARRRFLSRILPPPPTDAELAGQDERADLEDKMENVYSYAMRVATGDAVPLRRRLQAVVLLMTLTVIQLIFAYTYADAASVMTVNQRYSANRDQVDFSLFYPDTSITRSGTFHNNGSFYALPKANLLASLASFFAVAFFMKDDTEATLKSVCPIDSLVWGERPTLSVRSAGSVLISLLLQCFWNVRAVVVPSLAGAGIGLLMSVTRNAVDITLNSIAIAFVFDLDELAYSWFVTKRMSILYEELGPPVPRQHPMIRRRYCSLVYLLDVYCMSSIYLHWSLGLDLWGDVSSGVNLQIEGLIRCYLYSRAWLVGLARCHLVLSARRSLLSSAPIQALVRTVAYAGIMIGAMPFLAYYCFYLLAQWLGARRSVGDYDESLNMEGANIKSCLEEVDDFVSCKDLHKSPSAFVQLTEKVCQGLSGSCAGKLPIWWSS